LLSESDSSSLTKLLIYMVFLCYKELLLLKRLYWMQFVPFWVILQRLSSNCRRFGTHYRFQLHRQVDEVCQWQDCAVYLYPVGLERGSGRANRKWCARTGQLVVGR